MTAAAERAVTFGSCFYRWKTRLLSCLGSSAAQGIGGRVIAPLQVGSAYVGRVRTPAPTGDLEAALSLGGGMRATRAPSSVWPNGQPPSPSKGEGLRAAQCAAPTKYGRLSGLSVGAGSRPDGGRTLCAPAAENGRDRWLRKLRRRSGTAPVSIFLSRRPQWAGRNLDTHSDFARRKDSASFKG